MPLVVAYRSGTSVQSVYSRQGCGMVLISDGYSENVAPAWRECAFNRYYYRNCSLCVHLFLSYFLIQIPRVADPEWSGPGSGSTSERSEKSDPSPSLE